MNRLKVALFGVLFVVGCGGTPTEGGDNPETEASIVHYSGATVIPGDGSQPIEEATFIVENGKITQFGGKGEIPPPKGAGRAELKGQTIMPVFFNLNAHPGLYNGAEFSAANYKADSVSADLKRYGYYGVAAVLSAGGDAGDVAFKIRDDQKAGKAIGSQIYTAGRGITAKGGYPTSTYGNIPIEVATADEAIKAVAENADNKVDFINIWVDDNLGHSPKLKPELSKAVIDEAHKRNLKVVAHVAALADAKDLVTYGVDALITSIRDREVDDALITMMKEKGVVYSPSLTGQEAKFIYADTPKWLGEQTMREVYPPGLSAYLANPVVANRFKRNADIGKLREQYSMAVKNLKKMSDAGVKIALGTDSGSADTYPGYFEHRELELMVAAGMTPLQVITAATSVPAAFLGRTDGVIGAGKDADLFVLSENPLEDIKNTADVVYLYKNGKEVDRKALITNLPTEVPKITPEDRKQDAAATAAAIEKARLDAMPHYGGLINGTASRVRGLSIPMPRGARPSVQAGPPSKISVSATGGNLRDFYTQILPMAGWKPAGACFERGNPVSNKTESLCVEGSATAVTLTITPK